MKNPTNRKPPVEKLEDQLFRTRGGTFIEANKSLTSFTMVSPYGDANYEARKYSCAGTLSRKAHEYEVKAWPLMLDTISHNYRQCPACQAQAHSLRSAYVLRTAQSRNRIEELKKKYA